MIGGLAVVAITALGRTGRLLDTGLMLPLGTSAVTIGFGMLITFDVSPVDWRASWWLVPVGHALVAVPFVVRAALGVSRSIDPDLRAAAATLGASPIRAWAATTLPFLRRPLATGAGLAAAISLGEFGATSFLSRSGSETLPIAIERLLGRTGRLFQAQAFALSTILAAATIVIVMLVDAGAATGREVTVLDVRDVTISFEGQRLLDRLALHLDAGEVVALLGPSGSGKSTLLRVIAGLVAPEAGVVTIDGIDVTRVPTHRRSVGMVFQDEQLFPHLSVADNVAFGLKMAGMPVDDRRRRAEQMLELVGLADSAIAGPIDLSGGEAKRVALARSLAPQPKVLLLDEPLTGLDRELHDRLAVDVASILRLAETTAVWVTHDPAEADTVADRVVRLDARQ